MRWGLRPRALVPAALLLAIGLVAAGCSRTASGASPDLRAAREFGAFPLYWLGERFEQWKLTAIDGLDRPAEFVTLIYGSCTPHGGDEPSCTPPLQLQVSPLCWHLGAVAHAPIWKRRQIRGAPVGTIDGAPVLFARGAQVKVYRGEGSDRGAPLRALRALRSLNRVPPVIGSVGRIPPPAAGILDGTRPCARQR